ncbi:hypothetical protein [Ramlibacter sp.]|jgi:hypothetical protein|uniref:hypothetical protein n=1 Tax=Ramlibacter sp. TaxID=1917967 RepID=UPI002FCB0E31|nr:hypothetical protein [Ramlibacter sp.]MCE3271534.1 hypothetical protein [Ramlibacter sp.]
MSLLRPFSAIALLASGAAHAHPGHGLPQAWHWHSTDTVGFLVVAVLAGLALWFTGKK